MTRSNINKLRFIHTLSAALLVSSSLFFTGNTFAAGDAEAGKAASATCAGCHGVDRFWPDSMKVI